MIKTIEIALQQIPTLTCYEIPMLGFPQDFVAVLSFIFCFSSFYRYFIFKVIILKYTY